MNNVQRDVMTRQLQMRIARSRREAARAYQLPTKAGGTIPVPPSLPPFASCPDLLMIAQVVLDTMLADNDPSDTGFHRFDNPASQNLQVLARLLPLLLTHSLLTVQVRILDRLSSTR